MYRNNNEWLHYVKNIIAADVPLAVFLASYLRHSGISREYLQTLEVIDLQKYKIISQPNKVRSLLMEKGRDPFVFVICKN